MIMIKRTRRDKILKDLEKEKDWKIVDLGCGRNGSCPSATVLVDQNDWSKTQEIGDREFVVHNLDNLPLPFKDKQFDFCWSSHILEHVKEPTEFLKEIVRISKRGYIEVPTPLIDNLVSGDDIHEQFGHKWWVFYDDVEEKIILRPRKHILHKTVDIPELNKLYPFFRSSFVIELYWEDDLESEMGDEEYSYEGKDYDLSKETIPIGILGESRIKIGS
jgi:ubiquinone/menaquinone biosynthesis C-methylase UbiE